MKERSLVECNLRQILSILLFCGLVFGISCDQARSQTDSGSDASVAMLEMLEKMVRDDPTQADSWRLIGRIHRKNDLIPEAIEAVVYALQLQPDNVAAHYDLGQLLEQTGDSKSASFHYDQVMQLAPESSYADQLVAAGIRPAPKLTRRRTPSGGFAGAYQPGSGQSESDFLKNVAYEVQTFDGADDLERRLAALQSDSLLSGNSQRSFFEFGTLYNTNVAVTPISREIARGKAASFQGFLSPNMEWVLRKSDLWRAGPLVRGYFTVNEGNFRALNLASFQPGAFFERDILASENQLVGRLEYLYSLDLLNGDRFGDRHSVTGSLTSISPNAEVIYAYVTASQSNFDSDGVDPSVNSLDGSSVTMGISKFFRTGLAYMPTWSIGTDIEWANTEGADYRYQAVNFHGNTTFQISPEWTFVPRVGVGFRNYNDFTGPVDRDEVTWRVGARLRRQLTESLSVSLVAGHDRFASDNANFDAERSEGGIVFTLIR